MKVSVFIFALLLPAIAVGQQKMSHVIQEIEAYHDSLNQAFKDPATSPLKPDDLANFSGLELFPIDTSYHLKAEFIRTPNQKPFKMPTTTSEVKTYEKYAEIQFTLHGKEISLDVFQSHELRETEKYKNYLFLPFRDETNGEYTYGGGRYLEMWIPNSDSVIVDFNKAYNPYCVYNTKYSCPLVPKENWISVPVYAGVMDFKEE